MGAPVGVEARVVDGDGATVVLGTRVGISVGVEVGGRETSVGVAIDRLGDGLTSGDGLADLGVAV